MNMKRCWRALQLVLLLSLFSWRSHALVSSSTSRKPAFLVDPSKTETDASLISAAAAASSTKEKNSRRVVLTDSTTQKNQNTRWNCMFDRLRDFYKQNGHSYVTKQDGDEELFQWTLSLRRNYRHQVKTLREDDDTGSFSINSRPCLSPLKLEQLSEVNFCWDVQSLRWQERCRQLEDFYTRYGHSRVACNSLEYPGLGIWVRNQRREYKRLCLGQPSTLTPDRVQALSKLGFEWYQSHSDAWQRRFLELEQFVTEHGHAHVPEDYAANPQLGQWCMNQRIAYRTRSKALTPERQQLLEELGFSWSYRQNQWDRMLQRLHQYYEQNGHVNIPTEDGANRDLRVWLTEQRYYYHQRASRAPLSDSTSGNRTKGLLQPHDDDNSQVSFRMSDSRIKALEWTIPNFSWKRRGLSGPSAKDWSKLFEAMRGIGISPKTRPKEHWFEGSNRFANAGNIKNVWTEEELLELWNQENEDDNDD